MNESLHQPVSRPLQVVVGIMVAIVGLFCLAIFGVTISLYLRRIGDPQNAVIVGTLFMVLGFPAVLFAFRLLLGRPRRADGGLIGPTGLRVAGVLFVAFPVLSLLQGSWDWLLGLTHLGASAACFTLANFRRRRRAQADSPPTHSQSAA